MEENIEKGVSVVICTYNGSSKLGPTLEHLRNQEFDIPFEIILVDNASTDGSKEYAEKWWKDHGNPEIEFHTFSQPTPGKSYAQELGYSKAKYELLITCDDDNWFSPNYVQKSFELMESNPKIGALGGWCEPVFESSKPRWFDQFNTLYAVSKQGNKSGNISNEKGCLYGAGMVVRKSHYQKLKSAGFDPLLTCRKGDTLSSGGDTEYCYALRLMGFEIWYDEDLYFRHFMNSGRLNMAYVKKLRKAMFESNKSLAPYLDMINKRQVLPRNFKNRFWGNLSSGLIKYSVYRVSTNPAKSELAKDYFRNLRYLWSGYEEYYNDRKFIENWYANLNPF